MLVKRLADEGHLCADEIIDYLYHKPLIYSNMFKYRYLGLVTTIVASLSGCNSHKNDVPVHDHVSEHEAQESHEGEGHGSNVIVLHENEAKELGVSTTVVEPVEFREVVKVSGMCEASPADNSVVVAPSNGIIKLAMGIKSGKNVSKGELIATISAAGMTGGDPNANARLAVEIAKRELERIEPLHREGIVSTRDYNMAVAEYQRALAAVGNAASGSRVTAERAGVLTDIMVTDGAYVDQGAMIASIVSNEMLLVRADVPVRYASMLGRISGCNMEFAGTGDVYTLEDLHGKVISNTSGGVKNGYIPVYFEIKNNGKLLNGMPVEVYIIGNNRLDALVVPLTSVTENQGGIFVYERIDHDHYRRIPVTLGNSDGKNVEVVSGLEPGEEIVTSGTLFVKLAESSGAVPEGHSHH